jgi:hypothetical protein
LVDLHHPQHVLRNQPWTKVGEPEMNWFMVVLPTFILVFGASFAINIFKDFMSMSGEKTADVQPVEVVNLNDFGRR